MGTAQIHETHHISYAKLTCNMLYELDTLKNMYFDTLNMDMHAFFKFGYLSGVFEKVQIPYYA